MKRSSGWLRRSIPRRMIHAIKVGLSLTLASLLYLMEPLFEGIGKNAIWAVMTVVVVLEFTAGETSFKCLNMGLGTVLAGTVAFLIEFIATKSGKIFQVVFFEATVFVIGAAATYTRFFPYLKKNYDSGILIFLSTFNLIIVSRYQDKNVLNIAHDQLYIIAIGCAACLFMSILVFTMLHFPPLSSQSICTKPSISPPTVFPKPFPSHGPPEICQSYYAFLLIKSQPTYNYVKSSIPVALLPCPLLSFLLLTAFNAFLQLSWEKEVLFNSLSCFNPGRLKFEHTPPFPDSS